MRKILIFLIFITALLCDAIAQSSSGQAHYLFKKANKAYSENNYDEAVSTYEAILNSGLESGNIYYNLGNCYFKKGEFSKAILNYERAKRLIPQDSDLKSNYEYVKSLLKGQPDYLARFRWLDGISDNLSVQTLSLLYLISFSLICLLLILMIFFPALRKSCLNIVLFTLLLFFLSLFALKNKLGHMKNDAVILQETECKYEPFDKATTYFTLSEGSLVNVISAKDLPWLKIKRADGKIGWVSSQAVELVSN